jgi:hypothetical protein
MQHGIWQSDQQFEVLVAGAVAAIAAASAVAVTSSRFTDSTNAVGVSSKE